MSWPISRIMSTGQDREEDSSGTGAFGADFLGLDCDSRAQETQRKTSARNSRIRHQEIVPDEQPDELRHKVMVSTVDSSGL